MKDRNKNETKRSTKGCEKFSYMLHEESKQTTDERISPTRDKIE